MRCDPKKFPKLDKVIVKSGARGKMQSQEQQMNLARLINAMHGGSVISKTES